MPLKAACITEPNRYALGMHNEFLIFCFVMHIWNFKDFFSIVSTGLSDIKLSSCTKVTLSF